jgi:hypothetical protein
MEAWIKDLSSKNCYTRFGKVIPKKEIKVDIIKYFGRDVLKELKNDPLIKVIVHNAQDKQTEKKEAIKKTEKVKEVEKKAVQRRKTVTKNLKRGK